MSAEVSRLATDNLAEMQETYPSLKLNELWIGMCKGWDMLTPAQRSKALGKQNKPRVSLKDAVMCNGVVVGDHIRRM